MTIVFLGLSITSSWGNGHATTYRGLIRALAERGHTVLFLERDLYWYAENRDLPEPAYCAAKLYSGVGELERRFGSEIARADAVVVGSYVPEGIAVGDLVQRLAAGVTAFYDIDTPVTLARLEAGVDYLAPRQIPRYDVYLSFTGGPTLERLQRRFGARLARPLYCSVDARLYYPEPTGDGTHLYDLGYLGTYSDDRQPVLDRLLLDVARRWPSGRFAVAGPQYPETIDWPANVDRTIHLEPAKHRRFYNTLRYTLNITRRDMVAAGYSPSVRLFEAAACGTPIISDRWPGLDTFFRPGVEILLADGTRQAIEYLRDIPDARRTRIGAQARERVLRSHTSAHRAAEFERAMLDAGLRAGASADPVTPAAKPRVAESSSP
jgi:spore maturation protein CgeB